MDGTEEQRGEWKQENKVMPGVAQTLTAMMERWVERRDVCKEAIKMAVLKEGLLREEATNIDHPASLLGDGWRS